MKRIDLIPEEAKKPGFLKYLKGTFFKSKSSRLGIIALGVLISINLWQIASLSYYKVSTLAIKAKIIKMQKTLDNDRINLASIENDYGIINRETKRVEEKLNVLEDIQQENIAWALTLERLSKLLPDTLWVNKVSLNKNTITLDGTAFDNAIISKFMSGLDESGYFNGTSFTYTKKAKVKDSQVMDFEVTTRLVLEKAKR